MKRYSFLFASVFLPFLVACGGETGTESPIEEENKVIELDTSSRADNGGSGVMLQGFTWSSPHLTGDWYSTISSNADEIKDTFEYVWFPPASDCTDTTGNGYLPRELNLLTQRYPEKINYYGSVEDLKKAITDIKPSKAIADVVINHRCGTTDWGDFTNPSWDDDFYAICKDDEGFSNKQSSMYGARKKGSSDTGEPYSAGRDLDHTNEKVQSGIFTWMNDVLKDAGFVGWRYDYVKGYAGNYVGFYNKKTDADFSVGEYWPTGSFSSSVPSTWSNLIADWIKQTAQVTNSLEGKTSRAFDFVLKGMMNSVFGCLGEGIANKDYSLLASEYNIYKKLPGYAVTFVDNHDTGSTQAHWYLDPDDIGAAYAFILTHPGYPCVAWYHYFDSSDCPTDNASQYIGGELVPGTTMVYKEFLKSLIQLRKTLGITDMSDITVEQADSSRYAARVSGEKGTAYTVIGNALDIAPEGFSIVLNGTGFQVFKSN